MVKMVMMNYILIFFCIQFANIFLKSFTYRFMRAVGLQLYFAAMHFFFFHSDFGIRVMLTSEISWEEFLPNCIFK